MEEHVSESVTYILCINPSHKNHIYQLRNYKHLEASEHDNELWIRGLIYEEVHGLEVTSIPFKTVFYLKEGFLFKPNHKLPEKRLPKLIWIPLKTLLPIELGSLNHNYFQLDQSLTFKLIPSSKGHTTRAMLFNLGQNLSVILNLPSFRLEHKTYAVLNGKELFVLGEPLLPCNAKQYWQHRMMFLPLGFDFNYTVLAHELYEKLVPDSDAIVIWNDDSTYFLIHSTELAPLSKSSLRLTIKELDAP